MSSDTHTLLRLALKEDQVRHDITSRLIVPKTLTATGVIRAGEEGVLCGAGLLKDLQKLTRASFRTRLYKHDGQAFAKGERLAELKGPAHELLGLERVILNLWGRLSGIATLTRQCVEAVRPYRTQILDTRKTTPGLRDLEKWAVRCGGGINHRFHLKEAVMIKDNHRALLSAEADWILLLKKIRRHTSAPIIVEADSLNEVEKILPARPDILLLDNMGLRLIRKAVAYRNVRAPRVQIEVSGGVKMAQLPRLAAAGVDRISMGCLTHQARWIDFSMEMSPHG